MKTMKTMKNYMKYLVGFFAITAMLLTGCDKNEPGANGPSVTWTDTDGTTTYDFSKRYKSDEVEILVKATTKNAFTGFTVDIISASLTNEVLQPFGLGTHLDLVNPGATATALETFGFVTGTGITSSASVSFNISGMMTMLSAFPGDCDFKLTVTDGDGTTVKTVKLNVVAPK